MENVDFGQNWAIHSRGRGYEVKKWTYLQKLLAPLFLDVILGLKKLSKIFF